MLGAGTQPDKPQHKPFAPHPARGQDTRAYPAEANTYHHSVLRGDCWLSHGMLREVFAGVWRSYDGLEMKTVLLQAHSTSSTELAWQRLMLATQLW